MSSHKVAVITQSSVKGPSSLKQSQNFRKSKASDERKTRTEALFSSIDVQDTVQNILEKTNGDLDKASRILDQKLSETNRLIQQLTEDRASLSREQFDERLSALKDQQRNTVALCENLYSLTHRDGQQPQSTKAVTFDDEAELDTRRSGDIIRASLAQLESRVSLDAWEEEVARRENLQSSIKAKPPLPRGRGRDATASSAAATAQANSGRSTLARSRPLSGSLDGRQWFARNSTDESEGDDDSDEFNGESDERVIKRQYQELLRSKVKAMWSDFDASAAAAARPRSGSVDRSWSRANREIDNSTRRSDAAADRWRHRITVPEPFSMTLRDEAQQKKKSRSMQLFEENQRRQQDSEEAECRVKFRANPVPAHVYVPLFDQLQEEREARRREVREHSYELLKSQEKPFGFAQRDQERQRRQKQKLREADKHRQYQRSTEGDRKETVVRARPVPHSASESRTRRLQEDELLRQIKVRMRAEEMLKRSAAPGEMMQRQQQMEEKKQKRLAKYERPGQKQQQQQQQQKKQRPHSADGRRRVGRDAPDFDRLHREFQLELLQRQAEVKITYPKPFRLHTPQRLERSSSKDKAQRDPKAVKQLYDYSRRYPTDERSARTLSTYEDAPPARLTHSAQLRETRRSSERDTAFQRQREEEAEQMHRQLRRRQLADTLRSSAADAEAALGPSISERTRSKIMSQRELEEDYRRRMRELNEKMRERDLLVVQQAKLMAQQKARAKYKQTLLDAGVDPSKVDEMARRYQDSDLAAYTDPDGVAGAVDDHDYEDDSTVPNGSEFDPDRQEEMDETRFGAPSPVPE